jgi:hypothetical protein
MPSLVEFYSQSPTKKYNLFEVELSIAKTVVKCDACQATIDTMQRDTKGKTLPPQHIQAHLELTPGNPKDYHLCDLECLRDFLVKKIPKTKNK